MPTLYQAEWCPYSSAVRQALTELGLDFVARQVASSPDARTEMRERTGTDSIPVLELDDGRSLAGADEILPFLASLAADGEARAHRERYAEHQEARERQITARLLERHVPR